ncbi:TKL family protein kinase [Tritrichomonas foetus]|uniref:TKL family protein kinase n=1 Tax=Tritrichomonas foetus TaxID=1144522 RepID=A0A1J4KYX0_9EUKA|nr:TKL family protein kinase [Tritrichomonas foetus]|eukprot:OHT16451.1 TKL family protein kinase [Tritrichomonas foetus]
MSNSKSDSQSTQDIIAETTSTANLLFPLAQESFVYRASIAYILQNIKSFIAAIQPFHSSELEPLEKQALQRFIGIVNHFAGVLPLLNKQKWMDNVINWPSVHIHSYIDDFRKTLVEICQQLNLDSGHVIKYDSMQDAVNKNADFQHLKKVLCEAREKAISITNSVDVQQTIEVRLKSIQSHLPKTKNNGKIQHHPSSENLPLSDLQQRMDKELSIFKDYDIPCDDLRLDVALGCGGFGTVFKATRLSTSELLAVKEVRSDKLSMSTWASLYSEVATMADLRHRYVLELVGAHIKEPYRIITRFCPGKSLFDRLHRSQSHLTPQRLTMLAYQVAEGMRFLHAHGIVHRDLKTMNILLDENDAAKIADFGLAGMMKDKDEALIGGVGTPHYTAPEVLERKRYGPKVDTYSYGVILWEMASRQIPFRDKTHQEIYDHVVTHSWRLPLNNSMPDPLKKLINRCWSQNPSDRPEFSEIVDLFENGKIFFRGCEKFNRSSLETPELCPPLDINYLTTILSNPSDSNFPKVVNFLEQHIDSNIKGILHKANIISHYNAQSPNTPSILLIAKEVLDQKEFPQFFEDSGNSIIQEILSLNHSPSLIAAAKFCLKVPDQFFSLIKDYVPQFVERMERPGLGPFVIRLLARLDTEEIKQFKSQIVEFITPTGILQVNDQNTLNAMCKLIPIIADKLTNLQFEYCIPLIEMDYDCPSSLIQLLIDKTNQSSVVRLLHAVVRAAARTDVTDCLIRVLRHCGPSDLRKVAKNYEVFDQIQKLLEEKKSVETALLLLFSLSTDEEIPPLLANHPLLHSVLQLEGHTAQRLQIFTALFSVEQFCSDTTISDGVLKLLVSSLDDERLTDYSMKLIGALSSHQSGCMLISGNGMLSLFSQMFLSSAAIDVSTALTILSNIATKLQNQEIPQLSLIISILMQDLIYSVTNKSDILQTLINLIKLSPNSVQEHDLQNSVLPLLSQRQEPVIIVLVLKLFDECEMPKLKNFYQQIAQKIFNILSMESMMYPELLSAAIGLITSIAMQYDLHQFIEQTDLIEFFTDIANQITEYEEIYANITNCIYYLNNGDAEPNEEDCNELPNFIQNHVVKPVTHEANNPEQEPSNSFESSKENEFFAPDQLEMPESDTETESNTEADTNVASNTNAEQNNCEPETIEEEEIIDNIDELEVVVNIGTHDFEDHEFQDRSFNSSQQQEEESQSNSTTRSSTTTYSTSERPENQGGIIIKQKKNSSDDEYSSNSNESSSGSSSSESESQSQSESSDDSEKSSDEE